MARKSQPIAANRLEEIESAADRMAEWVRDHLPLVGAAIAVLLIATGSISYWASARADREAKASGDLAIARFDYLIAMGASPGAFVVPELANPEAAAPIRSDFEAQLARIAREYPGTAAGTLAQMDAALLTRESGDPEAALAAYDRLLAGGIQSEALRGLALQRAAQVLEDLGRWDEAAERHELAAALSNFPLRSWALADAARCRAEAGDAAGALALYERLERSDPDLQLPPHLQIQRSELRARAAAL